MALPVRPGMTVPLPGPLHSHREKLAELADLGYTDIWSAESDGADAFTPLALAAAWEPRLRLGTAIVPAPMCRSLVPSSCTTPQPVRRLPGSMPSTRIAVLVHLRERLLAELEVGKHVLDVVVVFEGFVQLN